jgi:hypothetical protein
MNEAEFRIYNGSNYSGFKAPTSISGDQILELPDGDGGVGQVMVTDGAGVLEWAYKHFAPRTSITSASYAAVSSDAILAVDYAGTVSITLPSPASGKVLIIKDEGGNAGSNTITINSNSSEVIDGASNITITTNFDSVTLISNGTDWFSI